ncbi:hypothetical protein Avbf_00237 [Armadillidium vulgare]|nr:hypothetical protein Avbf_00237 [Armadillidium vulgare]
MILKNHFEKSYSDICIDFSIISKISIKCGQYCFQGFECSSFSSAFITASASASYTTVQEEQQQQQHRRCNICGKVFRGESSKKGSGLRSSQLYLCCLQVLDETLSSYSDTGDKGLICKVCQREFVGKNQRSLLRRHFLIHTGEKPFQCSFCPYKSNQSGNVQLHMKSVHYFRKY